MNSERTQKMKVHGTLNEGQEVSDYTNWCYLCSKKNICTRALPKAEGGLTISDGIKKVIKEKYCKDFEQTVVIITKLAW